MELQGVLYDHITSGVFMSATPVIARIALHLGYDPRAYPVSLSELTRVGSLPRCGDSYGFGELLVADYVRATMLEGTRPWDEDEVEALKEAARSAPRADLYAISG